MPAAATREVTHAQRCFHALSDETRLHLIELLRAGEQCVCDLTDSLETAQSRLSFHLRVLKDAGLVTDRRAGRWVYYAVDVAALDALLDFLAGLRPRRGGPRLAPRRYD